MKFKKIVSFTPPLSPQSSLSSSHTNSSSPESLKKSQSYSVLTPTKTKQNKRRRSESQAPYTQNDDTTTTDSTFKISLSTLKENFLTFLSTFAPLNKNDDLIVNTHSVTCMIREDIRHNTNVSTKKKFILCLPGGGIKGLFAAAFIQNLHNDHDLNIRTADLYAGASIGGLMSAILTVPNSKTDKTHLFPTSTLFDTLKISSKKMFTPNPIHKALEFFSKTLRDFRKTIHSALALTHLYSSNNSLEMMSSLIIKHSAVQFLPTILDTIGFVYQLLVPKYSETALISECKNLGETTTLGDLTGQVMIMQSDITDGTPAIPTLHSNKLTKDIFVYQSIRATIAAPTLYSTYVIGDKTYTDGGLSGHNDPTEKAIDYAHTHLHIHYEDMNILVLDTGVPRHKLSYLNSATIFNLIDIFGLSRLEKKHNIMDNFNKLKLQSYTYIDPQDIATIPMDSTEEHSLEKISANAKKLADLIAKDSNYTDVRDNLFRIATPT